MRTPFVFRRSFTLIEIVVVISIILVISGLVLPAITSMWNQTHIDNAHQIVSKLLQVAKVRSESFEHIAYGLLFYTDPKDGREVIVSITALTYPNTKDEKWASVCDRFTIDTSTRYSYPMEGFVRIAPFELLEWGDIDLLNDDYRTGKQRNFFAIIFERGKRIRPGRYILYDEDADVDGLGDTLGLVVGDVDGEFGGPLRDIVLDSDGDRLVIPTDWGFLIYDANVFKELRNNLNFVSYLPYYLTREGRTIALERTGS